MYDETRRGNEAQGWTGHRENREFSRWADAVLGRSGPNNVIQIICYKQTAARQPSAGSAPAPPAHGPCSFTAETFGYFLGDIKAVLNGCEDRWTLQEGVPFPVSLTVCVNVRVVSPGPWIAFSYVSVHGLKPDLGLEGDDDELSVWLLRVKHIFPLTLTQQDWHQVCLRRDVGTSSLKLEVDNAVVGQRMVISQAIPSFGSLWLGCAQRDQITAPALGHVELYLFRMWPDLDQHLPCEDGSVIGWSSEFWGVTSAKARKKDNDLPCGLNCHIERLCSSDNFYFWMPVSVQSAGMDIRDFISRVLTCDGRGSAAASTRSDFDIFCLDVDHFQVENVSCLVSEDKSQSQCGILLQLSSLVSVCKLRQAALSALQQSPGSSRTAVNITGAVERVGRNVCDGVDPSSGGFVTCSSSLSLEQMCQSNDPSTLNCKILDADHVLDKETTPDSCTS
ncbi:hypothetical protein WMY93_029556 [Mugilogobius chulae]|uniref:Uncharacterized protein n=1 Tax=Mugilogobius chulae TaxID=88201 RepID=A0AAW0MK73_9GOBI